MEICHFNKKGSCFKECSDGYGLITTTSIKDCKVCATTNCFHCSNNFEVLHRMC